MTRLKRSLLGAFAPLLMATQIPSSQAVVGPPPVAQLDCGLEPAVESACPGTPVPFTVVIDPFALGNIGAGPYNYVWTDQEGNIIAATIATAALSDTINVTEPGVYHVVVTDSGFPTQQCLESAQYNAQLCVPGATRTIGYWQTHLAAMQEALSAGCVDLGILDALPSGTQNLTAPTLAEAEAIMWGKIGGRSALGRARMQLGQQLVGAMINVCYVGTAPQANGFSPTLIQEARAALDGTDIDLILFFVDEVDAFNNSGDSFPIGTSYGPAKPKAARNAAAASPGPAFD